MKTIRIGDETLSGTIHVGDDELRLVAGRGETMVGRGDLIEIDRDWVSIVRFGESSWTERINRMLP